MAGGPALVICNALGEREHTAAACAGRGQIRGMWTQRVSALSSNRRRLPQAADPPPSHLQSSGTMA
jgi:hypothetical protein